MEKRVFSNPFVKDVVTFIETAKETNGKYTLVEVELAPGGGVVMHTHASYEEEFTAVEGVLGIGLGKKKLQLQPGEIATAGIGQLHRFYNPGKEFIRFRVKLTPGYEGFEHALKIGYGLAEDGHVNKKGMPKSFEHIALLTIMSDTKLPGILSMFGVLLRWKASKAIKKGVDKELIRQYC